MIDNGLYIDNFAGGGGASTEIEWAIGRSQGARLMALPSANTGAWKQRRSRRNGAVRHMTGTSSVSVILKRRPILIVTVSGMSMALSSRGPKLAMATKPREDDVVGEWSDLADDVVSNLADLPCQKRGGDRWRHHTCRQRAKNYFSGCSPRVNTRFCEGMRR